MMKILFTTLFCFLIGNIYAQSIRLQDDDISVLIELQQVNDTTFQYQAIVENRGQTNIYFYRIEETGKSYLRNYIGIGLYSAMYPYLPTHTTKFKDIETSRIEPKSKQTFEGTFSWIDKDSISIALDYYADTKKKHKGKEVMELDLKSYDMCIRKLKGEFSLK